MQPGRYDSLRQLIDLGASSLLQYVGEASPWYPREAAGTLDRIQALAAEERDEVARVTRWLQKKHERVPVLGSFPSHFTTMNFVTLDYLLPKLVADNQRETREVEHFLGQSTEEDVRSILQGFLDLKQKHGQALSELASAKSPVAG